MQIREKYNDDYTNTAHYFFCHTTTPYFPQEKCRTPTTHTTAFMMRGKQAQEIIIQHMATLEKAVLYKSVVILLCSIYLRHSIYSKLIQFNLRQLLAFSFWVHFPKTAKSHLAIWPQLFILFIHGIFVNF